PSHVRISRAINIEAGPEKIQPYIASLDQWKRWNAFLADSSMKLDIRLRSTKPDSVTTVWTQADGRSFHCSYSLMPSGDLTIVQCYFDFYLRWYPWEKFGSIIYDQQMGPGMEKSLTRLKSLVESSH
ncbi:MAG TPA: hypothetical protein VD996_15045, partial [Chitinophagaceae bacterium]|nr:hypothetical protein [Chitinophagaceae bacterium]